MPAALEDAESLSAAEMGVNHGMLPKQAPMGSMPVDSTSMAPSIPPLTFGQQVAQGVVASGLSSFAAFPVYALQLDVQAGQAINLAPHHLFRGVGAGVGKTLPANTILIAMNSVLRGNEAEEEVSLGRSFLYSAVSGTFAALAAVPFELTATRQRALQTSASEVWRDILKKRGVLGGFQGASAIIGRDIVFAAGILAVPDLLEQVAPESWSESRFSHATLAGAGGAAVGIFSLPFDVARGHMQRAAPGERVPGLFEAMQKTAKEEGIPSLFKGYPFRATYVAILGFVIDYVGSSMKDHFLAANEREMLEKEEAVNPAEALGKREQKLLARARYLQMKQHGATTRKDPSFRKQDRRIKELELARQQMVEDEGFTEAQANHLLVSLNAAELRARYYGNSSPVQDSGLLKMKTRELERSKHRWKDRKHRRHLQEHQHAIESWKQESL